MKPDDFWRAASARVEAVRVVGSALNPLLWLTGLVTPLSLMLSYFSQDVWKAVVFFVIAVFPIGLSGISYLTLLRRDPDRLQSEEFRLKQRALKMLYRRGANAEVLEAAKDIVRVEISTARHEGEDR
jgi:hypothetical protein